MFLLGHGGGGGADCRSPSACLTGREEAKCPAPGRQADQVNERLLGAAYADKVEFLPSRQLHLVT